MKIESVVSQLKEILKEEGNLEVFCTSDHGQDYENIYDIGVSDYIEEDSEVTLLYEEDLDDRIEDGWEIKRAVFIN